MILEADKLCFSYKDRPVLHDVSLCCASGTVLGILGPNGSGKSTLVKCLQHILPPAEGRVVLDGHNLGHMTLKKRALAISYIPQSLIPAPGLSVYEAILLGRVPRFRWRPRSVDYQRVDEIIAELGITKLTNRFVASLSGGERQKVLIARSLCRDTSVLVFDEMTNNLDLKHQIEILDLIHRKTKEQELITVLVLHDLNLASLYCDSVLLLEDGRCRATGHPRDVLNQEQLQSTYGIRPLIISHQEHVYVLPRKQVVI
ncbi:MAG: ABC transporter ATP-binding protein [Spirochaetaceae bacterium]|nr:MAG: ABC transporter ATP-binding protein [Spirochaetaceae bacterium]